jgi:hypothetical protein
MGAEMFHADGQTGGHRHVETEVAFRIFANASEHWFLMVIKDLLIKTDKLVPLMWD